MSAGRVPISGTPLATNFAVRYPTGGAFSSGTGLIVWRDSKTNPNAFTCPATTGRPSWYPWAKRAS
jgi:hypothetical protein